MTFFFVLSTHLSAQDKCGIIAHTQNLRSKNPLLENDQNFEEWLYRKSTARKAGRVNELSKTYTVPVVVHVIHKGEAIGTGVNISDEQIASQIKVLNKDFKRLNADTVNTPTEFQSLAGKFNIEFVLAKQSPDGIASTGIVRVKGSKTTWSTTDDTALKATSYWPAEDYLNIWVTDLSSTLLGYAQFPISSLSGLEDAEDNRLTDGVVIDYTTFGSIEDGSFNLTSSFNRGRTTTHELGHFFGLRHIWGDVTNSCSGTDYVTDTPNQNNSTSGCPTNPQTVCSVHKMFQNYMDYTNDVCMNIYTLGQVDRMVTVMENSPRRVSLLTSHGLEDPLPVANDIAISDVISPLASHCDGSIVPVLLVTNKGSNSIASVSIQLSLNNTILETKVFTFSPALLPGADTQLSFSSQSLNSGSYTFSFQVAKVNGVDDGKFSNNLKSIVTLIPQQITAPFSESFNTLPSSWSITNSDQSGTWAIATAPQLSTSNTAIRLNYFQSTDVQGQTDVITSPVFDLFNAANPYFAFDVAYAFNGSGQDELKVYVIADCSGLTESNKLYDKIGSVLGTVTAQTTSFTPSGATQWRREIISLEKFKGSARVQLAFVGVNGQGNNLYVDNIAVSKSVLENVSITKITSPTPVRCDNNVQPVLLVKNEGGLTINSLKIKYSLNGGATLIKYTDTGFQLPTNGSVKITLPQLTLTSGNNSLSFELTEPNGWNDIDASDNIKTIISIVNTDADRIPLREKFESVNSWVSVSPSGDIAWDKVSTNYNQSMSFAAFNNTATDEAWLVSPVIDFSSTSYASVFFDLSYRQKNSSSQNKTTASDSLKVFGSSDCGNTYNKVLLVKSAEEITPLSDSKAWLPAQENDWTRTYINLDDLAGETRGRIAFVFVNGNGNNVYLDNIEFFESDNPTPPSITDPFVIYNNTVQQSGDFFITFNLEDRQPVNYELLDLTGRSIVNEQLEDVLNQTYQVATTYAASGIYILRLHIGDQFYARKVFVEK